MGKRGPKPSGSTEGVKSASSIAQVCSILKYPREWVKAALRSENVSTPGGRYSIEAIKTWVEANQDKLSTQVQDLSLKEQKTAEEVRKLKIANDQKAGRLVERAWINERFQKLGGEINAIRSKSEAEDAVKFGEASGDIAKCRTVLRGIWDDIFTKLSEAGKHFEE